MMRGGLVLSAALLVWASAPPATGEDDKPGATEAAAPSAQDPDPASRRILELERKLDAAQRYILGLRAELDNLKAEAIPTKTVPQATKTVPQADTVVQAADPTKPTAPPEDDGPSGKEATAPSATVRPSGVADRGGAAGAPRSAPPPSTTVARAPTPEPAQPKPPPRSEEEPGPDPTQQQPVFTPAFLRQARAVLIPRNRLEIEPRLQYSFRDTNVLAVSGLDLVEAVFIGKIEVEKRRRQSLSATLGMRYGIADRLQVSLTIPYLFNYEELIIPPQVQRFPNPFDSKTSQSHDLGDIEFGLSYHLLREHGWRPDLILSATAKSDTGRGPFDLRSGDLATGSGFWGVRPQLTFVKVTDPGVLFASASYLYHHPDRIEGFGKVDPGDLVQWSAGYAYALNPFLSLTTRIESTYILNLEIGGEEIDGTDAVVSALSFGLTYGLGRHSSLEATVDIGISEDAPDFRVSLGMPFQFTLSSDFWGRLVPDLSKLRASFAKLVPGRH